VTAGAPAIAAAAAGHEIDTARHSLAINGRANMGSEPFRDSG
jgi:hypothetical protein